MLVSDYVEARWTELQEHFILYSEQFNSRSYSSFVSLLSMVDRLTVETSCLLELAKSCCSEYPDLVKVIHCLYDDSEDLCSDLIKSRYKAFERSVRR